MTMRERPLPADPDPARRIALAVIGAVSRARPADAVLRDVLESERGASPAVRREAVRTVFAWYRWLGWTDPKASLASRLERALEVAKRFAGRPESFADADLLAKALPGWLAREMEPDAAFARALQAEPRVWLRAKPGTGAALAAALGQCRPLGTGALADALAYEGSEDLFLRPEFTAGAFEIQDTGSQLVGLMCAPKPGETWWDACAGEGGKTLHLSALMENRGSVWATDRAEWRLRRLRRRAARAQAFNLRWAIWEGGPKRPNRVHYDGILVDAPCSGMGTWARNPHARWSTTAGDVRELASLQLRLLAHTAPALVPGGRLLYAVCTLTRAETVDTAAALVARCPELEPLPLANPLRPGDPPAPVHALMPHETGGNGMWVAAWRRR